MAGESGGRPEDWTSLEYRIMGYIAKRNRERKEADAIPEDMLAAEKGDMEPKASLGAFGQGEEAEPEEAEEAMAQAAQTEEEDMTIFVIGTDGRDQEIRVSKSAMAEELRNLEESYLEEEVLGEPQPEYQEDRALEEKIGAPQGESPLFGEQSRNRPPHIWRCHPKCAATRQLSPVLHNLYGTVRFSDLQIGEKVLEWSCMKINTFRRYSF